MKVTVAIPVYNSAPTLERCVRSAMRQSMSEIEIIIADDGSSDGSDLIATRLAAEDSRIQVMRFAQNGGKPRAMNAMIARAKGEWIAVLDADDAYHPERLACLLRRAEATGVQMVADNLRYIDAGVGQALRTAFPATSESRLLDRDDLINNANSFADFDYGLLKPVLRRDFIESQQIRYNEKALFGEDFYYLLDIFLAGGRACLVGEALYDWTLPFGTVSRTWTKTGNGAWRYNYAHALSVNDVVLDTMRRRGETTIVDLLLRRARYYRIMIPYMEAQRHAAEGHRARAVGTILKHPETIGLLLKRVAGRLMRAMRPVHPLPIDGLAT